MPLDELGIWVGAGLDPVLFWTLTPREVCAVLDGAGQRLRREANADARLAWLTANLSAYAPQKSKDFPKLERLMQRDPRERRRAPDPDQDFARLSAWARSRENRT